MFRLCLLQFLSSSLLLVCQTGNTQAWDTGVGADFSFRELGNFWIGGEFVDNGNGTQSVRGQTYVEYYLPANPLPDAPPIVLVPGGGLLGSIYGTTPDMRPGWALYFAIQGFDVYTTEPYGRGRAGSGPWNSAAWVLWDMGEEPGVRCDNCAFPEEAGAYRMWMSQFAGPEPPAPQGAGRGGRAGGPGGIPTASAADRLGETGGPGGGQQTAALTELLDQTGKAVVIAHSAGGAAALRLAAARPELFAALITVEPSGCPGLGGEQLAALPYMNLLGEYGNLTTHTNCMALMKQSLEAGGAGGAARFLPDFGLTGHGHLLMQETRNDEIAQLMIDWISAGYPNEIE